MHAKKGVRKMDWFKPVDLEQKIFLPVGIRNTPTKLRGGTGVSTKNERTRRPSHDGTVYYDKARERWVGQLPATRKWDGTMRRPSVTGKSQDEVIIKMRQMSAKAMSPDAVDPLKLRVSDWIEVFFEDFKTGKLSPTTIRDYRSIMDTHVIPAIGDMQLQKVTPLHVQRILNQAEKRGLSPGRVIKIANTVSSLFTQAKRARLVEYNPASADSCNRPKLVTTYNERAPLPEEVTGFWQEAKADPVALAVCLSLACSFRRGELLGLRWSDVHLETGIIDVRQTIVEGEDGIVVKDPKSKSGKREIAVPKIMTAALVELKEKQSKEKRTKGKSIEELPVFRTKAGKIITPSNFSRSFRRIRDKLGFKDLRLKSFRHGHATILDEINAPLKVRQERMGHAEMKTTMNIYTHTQKKQHQKVANELNQALEEVLKNGQAEINTLPVKSD